MESTSQLSADYWETRYDDKNLGWDVGHCSRPLQEYFDQLPDKEIHILIPGSGNSYEAEYLHDAGFSNVFVADWAKAPLMRFQERVPDFPSSHLLQKDFFQLKGQYDLIIEQTFFCALERMCRERYVQKVSDLLKPSGKLVGVLFNSPMCEDKPPFGGDEIEYRRLFARHFETKIMENCYNSERPRAGNELFINLMKKS